MENERKTIRDIFQLVINLLVGYWALLDVIGAQHANIEQLGQDMMNGHFDKYNLKIIDRFLNNADYRPEILFAEYPKLVPILFSLH